MMPYDENNELPGSVQKVLPTHAQDIYRKAFNNAWEEYKNPGNRREGDESREEVSHRVAWNAVKKTYSKDDSGQWEHD
jgi:cation transport regulator